ncbi:hypothetical protein RFI_15006 [Reticulomyxa filosa]|uniref:Uncharacterized protein n=1 Tax=Reticulomyxa filosa TaxID=46433 RepID=X6N8F4_RETFI|nr:hypothetical protein RFI_15006 [Reticulomyxa filosa]|eukprot:ETO22193.1 hypothetical protein RFI_15006 [Reticulomyxa filosa]
MCNSADDTKVQSVSIHRMPKGYDHLVSVYWEIDYYSYANNVHTYRTRQLLNVKEINSMSSATTDIGINPTNGVVFFNANEFEQKIEFVIEKQVVASGSDKYKWYVLYITECNSSLSRDYCTPVYPSILEMKVDVTGESDSSTKNTPKWVWWLVACLVIFVIISVILGYCYWRKRKQAASEILEIEGESEHALEENEIGFDRDFDVPGQVKAPVLFEGGSDERTKDAADVHAGVTVGHAEQFGEQGTGHEGERNDLLQPLFS